MEPTQITAQDIYAFYVLIGFIIILLIWVTLEDYKDNMKKKKRERERLKRANKYKYLTGEYRHIKTPLGSHIEIGYHGKGKIRLFRRATIEELKFLKLYKHKKLL